MARSDRFTITQKTPVVYSDFARSFAPNPLTGLLTRVQNEVSVMQSIENLCLTRRRERFNNPLIGSAVDSMLFDPLDGTTAASIQSALTETIQINEPRVSQFEVTVTPDFDNNAYSVLVTFTINQQPQVFTFTTILSRVR